MPSTALYCPNKFVDSNSSRDKDSSPSSKVNVNPSISARSAFVGFSFVSAFHTVGAKDNRSDSLFRIAIPRATKSKHFDILEAARERVKDKPIPIHAVFVDLVRTWN